ncbi:glycoside hydrolase family 2 TIM barrel-domain containing protein [Actinoplanes sp. NBRC 103695]|uniref:glycoside hydrolase family 2 TIM barrel-domain containing protein n=1 Tax=Actinoplanes sp. NBRC 103695 TaxID=3032202 RepID=UPI00255739B4|nr:glycoside hydrolase family 2 TIM barrel-domain containing protein [Actinoplanes sp. NBRC 103695]
MRLAAVVLMMTGVLAAPQGTQALDIYRYLDDPQLTQEGQEEPHADLRPYPDERSAAADVTERNAANPYSMSLNGSWRLKLFDKPTDVPDVRDWQEDWPVAQVPHTWQSDFIDHPIFRNIPSEIVPDDPPRVPRDVNPTGAYVKTFSLPREWDGKRTVLRFEGVTSNYLVWVNGDYVGYDQGGYTPAEFDITARLHAGKNTIAVQVHRWGSGAYLEDVDQWRYSGIFRDVWLYRTEQSYIKDAYITTNGDTASIRTKVAGGGQVTARLLDDKGRIAAAGTDRLTVPGARRWSAEDPNLYTLILQLTVGGKVVHTTSQVVGFRDLAVRDKQILVDGKRILIKGVNRAETNPDTGRAATREFQKQDVFTMKRLHVNAIRTSHYPSDPYLYRLADRYGMYIDDEVDIETHNHESCPNNCLADRPEWQAAFADRFRAMVERDKNHPSVIFWDTGNEAGLGAAHYAMAAWADANEPTRLLYHQSNSPDGDAPYADVDGPRYPTPARLEARTQSSAKPIVMGEYAHAMGNGLGNFDEFWALARRYPSMQGGFIWDWAEQNLRQPLYMVSDQAFLVGKPTVENGVVDLSGLDDFVDVFRDPRLDLTDAVRLEARVKPGAWSGSFPILTKGLGYALQMRDRDTLEFGADLNGWTTVAADVPASWYDNWHTVSGSYDGSRLSLVIDGAEVATVPKTGKVDPGLYEVNIGHNAETQQDNDLWSARTGHGEVDYARIYGTAAEPVLALEFDQVRRRGDFLSLGISLSGTDGLVGSDRYLQPEVREMAWAQSPIRVTQVSPTVVRLTNEQQAGGFRTRVRWELTEQERALKSGSSVVAIGPGESRDITVEQAPANPNDRERFLTVRALSTKATEWAPAGWVLGQGQFAAGGRAVPGVLPAPVRGAPKLASAGGTITVSGDDFRYRFDGGTLASMRADGRELLRGGPALSVIRPPTSNETYDWGTDDRRVWHDIGMDAMTHTVTSVESSTEPDAAVVTVTSRYAGISIAFDQTLRYRIDRNGTVTLRQQVTPSGSGTASLPYLPRVGLSLKVPDAMQKFAYYARGPQETYNDRKSGAAMGVYRSTVADEYVRYSRPQAYGNHTDARWAALTDGTNGLLVGGMNDVSVTQYDELARAEYDHQLPLVKNRGWVTLHALAGETGMGETPNSVLAPYRLPATRSYSQELVLRPLTRGEAARGGVPGSDVPAPCPPTVDLNAPDTVTPGTPAAVDVTVTARCAEGLTSATVTLDVPDGWTVTPPAVTLSGAGTASFQVTAPAGTDVGTHELTATVVSSTPSGFTSTTTASATVQTPLPPGYAWLSDRPFEAVSNGWGPVERDLSNGEQAAGDGDTLTIAGKAYAKGLGVHALSVVRVPLGGGCTRFRADAGVDDETGSGGSVVSSVWLDGRQLTQTARLTGEGPATPVDVDLTGGTTLELRVTDAGDGNGLDHADWAGARISCTP